jgi:hypothetical protein
MKEVYSLIPPEVKIEKACQCGMKKEINGSDVYYIYPMAEEYAKKGYWIASYNLPFLGFNTSFDVINYKKEITRYVHHKWSGIYALAHSTNIDFNKYYCSPSISAIAEWGWNCNGRTPKDFAIAWATVNKIEKADKVGEWAEFMLPLEYEIVKSGIPIHSQGWNSVVKSIIKNHNLYGNKLGDGIYQFYPTETSFSEKLDICEKALKKAEEINSYDLLFDTKLCKIGIIANKASYNIVNLTVPEFKPENKELLKRNIEDLNSAVKEYINLIDSSKERYSYFGVFEKRKAEANNLYKFINETVSPLTD